MEMDVLGSALPQTNMKYKLSSNFTALTPKKHDLEQYQTHGCQNDCRSVANYLELSSLRLQSFVLPKATLCSKTIHQQ